MKKPRLRVRAADVFRIRERFDKGGFQFLLITRVRGRHVYVRDLLNDGRTVPDRPERKLGQGRWSGHEQLQRFWKRCPHPLVTPHVLSTS